MFKKTMFLKVLPQNRTAKLTAAKRRNLMAADHLVKNIPQFLHKTKFS